MIETLYVYALLLKVGFNVKLEYGEHLDALFLETPDNDLLLELEWSFSDTENSIALIRFHCYEYDIDYNVFGSFLFKKLRKLYKQYNNIEEFGSKSYALWQQLPDDIQYIEPFETLIYAADPIS